MNNKEVAIRIVECGKWTDVDRKLDRYLEVFNKLENNTNEADKEIERLKRQIKIKDEWCKRIWEIGCDYDGYGNDLEGLRGIVDELVAYSNYARNCDDKTVAYIGWENGKEIKENILMERIESDKE